MNDDVALMQSVKAGCKESFEKLVLKYRTNAISFAMKYVKTRETAEDIVQDSFASIYVYSDRYTPRSSFKTYLFRVVRNKCIDFLRKNSRLVYTDRIGGDACAPGDIFMCASKDIFKCTSGDVFAGTPEDIFITKETGNIVRKKIMELKEDYRTALYLVEYEDMSYREAAEIMGKSLVQFKALVYRARCRMKKMLEDVL